MHTILHDLRYALRQLPRKEEKERDEQLVA
jgi:hypothetical protein